MKRAIAILFVLVCIGVSAKPKADKRLNTVGYKYLESSFEQIDLMMDK